MSGIIFTRVHHSMEEEFGYLSEFGCIEISNGICWLAAVTRARGIDTEIVDALPLGLNNRSLAKLLTDKKPVCVGISACTMDIFASSDLAEKIKSINPKIKIIIGGPHITAVPDETMTRFPAFDIGVLGEGEETIVELMEAITAGSGENPKNVNGIIYRKNAKLVTAPPRLLIKDLDTLPLPAWDLLPNLKENYFPPAWSSHKGETSTITTSRGCPYQCIYCDRKVFGNRIRYHSTEYVMEMLKTLYHKYGISYFRIGDDNIMVDKKRLSGICNSIIDERLKISWSCLARADQIDSDMLALMKKAGCQSIAFGVETGSQKIHEIEKKHIRLDQIERGVRLTRKAGIKTISFNIIGHPMETVETIKKTIEFNKRIKVDEFKTQFMVPFPGTELYQYADKYGTLDRDWRKMSVFHEPIFVPHGLTAEEMIKWNKKGFNSFYLQPRIVFSYISRMQSLGELKKIVRGALTMLTWKLKDLRSLLGKKEKTGV